MSIKVAVEGCCHGELNAIYDRILKDDKKPDVLLILGDFQSLRHEADLETISMPKKYRKLGDFHEYYNGTKTAPVFTIFIGGNHEASLHLKSLPYGGYVAENMYYMGYSSVVWYKGLRIGGLSGIFKQYDFYQPHNEVEMDDKTIRSIYHVRFEDYLPLYMIQKHLPVMLTHDWPNEVVKHGNLSQLLKKKPFFADDIERNALGSGVNWVLLKSLKPSYWFSAHLHVKFEALIEHSVNSTNSDEIDLELSDDEDSPTPTKTQFLALDKCLPKRQFIEYLDIEVDTTHESFSNQTLYYDSEWIGNLQCLKTHGCLWKGKQLNQVKREKLCENTHETNADLTVEYTTLLQQQEEEQTRTFEQRFL